MLICEPAKKIESIARHPSWGSIILERKKNEKVTNCRMRQRVTIALFPQVTKYLIDLSSVGSANFLVRLLCNFPARMNSSVALKILWNHGRTDIFNREIS